MTFKIKNVVLCIGILFHKICTPPPPPPTNPVEEQWNSLGVRVKMVKFFMVEQGLH